MEDAGCRHSESGAEGGLVRIAGFFRVGGFNGRGRAGKEDEKEEESDNIRQRAVLSFDAHTSW